MEQLRNLPSPLNMSKREVLELLLAEEYGRLPSLPHTVTAEVESVEKDFCAGKA